MFTFLLLMAAWQQRQKLHQTSFNVTATNDLTTKSFWKLIKSFDIVISQLGLFGHMIESLKNFSRQVYFVLPVGKRVGCR